MYISTFALVCIVAFFFWLNNRHNNQYALVCADLRRAEARCDELMEWYKTEEGRTDRAREGFRHISDVAYQELKDNDDREMMVRVLNTISEARDYFVNDKATAYKDAPWEQK
ncbi:hypothetical protein ACVOZ6_003449 [Escherichia coli]